jgi:hypothetical protein
MLIPEVVVHDLVAFVFKIKKLFDALTLVLVVITVALTGLVLLLSARLRAREMGTLHRLGCSPGMTALLHGSEIAFLFAWGAVVAGVLVAATLWLVPDPLSWLGGP